MEGLGYSMLVGRDKQNDGRMALKQGQIIGPVLARGKNGLRPKQPKLQTSGK